LGIALCAGGIGFRRLMNNMGLRAIYEGPIWQARDNEADQGSRYTGAGWITTLTKADIKISMPPSVFQQTTAGQ
tara:strand:- start:3572 stop:3793 length:222 start_codon:yes stop_codon:yes gene_type:complete